jgi:hypothetical protein
MEKKQKIIQIYAVIICIVSIIAFLISMSGLVSSIIDRNDPLYTGRSDTNLASFENFKMDVLKSTQKDQAYIPDEETLLKMYEEAKIDKIKRVEHNTYRDIVVSSFIIVISLILFGTHWWLMKKMKYEEVKKVNSP